MSPNAQRARLAGVLRPSFTSRLVMTAVFLTTALPVGAASEPTATSQVPATPTTVAPKLQPLSTPVASPPSVAATATAPPSSPAPVGTPAPNSYPTMSWGAPVGNGLTAAEYLQSQARQPAETVPLATPEPPVPADQSAPMSDPTPTPRPSEQLGSAQLTPSPALSGLWKVVRYRDLVQRSARRAGVDPAILAALLEIEDSDERTTSSGGGLGLMQLRRERFEEHDDPFDPPTNLLRAAQHLRRLDDRWRDPALVAAAYFGAIDDNGNALGASGSRYVARFLAAFARYSGGLTELPMWLSSPLGDLPLTSDMIKFGFFGDYGAEAAVAIRGERGIGQFGSLHLALDLQVAGRPDGGRGTPVVAPFDGKITRTADGAGGPYGVLLDSKQLNLRARLMHMDGLVKGIDSGVTVKAGQQLGILGAQGTEGFPHLHLAFERLSDGERINPSLFYRLKDSSDPATLLGRWYEDQTTTGPDRLFELTDSALTPGGGRLGGFPGKRLYVSRGGAL